MLTNKQGKPCFSVMRQITGLLANLRAREADLWKPTFSPTKN
ncbi:hypothetical protein HMPREF1567_0161 [Providencia alcalifaciens PAL-2]|nr:hypothetical protein HMPREF1562_2454 [Providencia alcalifaciens F90-2004]EUC94053.1 hypothetical protein HMPREF1567_0161 [Providencia alcalifaciens PAL-2]